AGGEADGGHIIAAPTFGLVLQVGFEDRLIFSRQRRLLTATIGLAWIVRRLPDRTRHRRPSPLALQAGVLSKIEHLGPGGKSHQSEEYRLHRASPEHRRRPCWQTRPLIPARRGLPLLRGPNGEREQAAIAARSCPPPFGLQAEDVEHMSHCHVLELGELA